MKYDIIYFIESICHSSCKKSTVEYGLSMLKDDGIIIIFDYLWCSRVWICRVSFGIFLNIDN